MNPVDCSQLLADNGFPDNYEITMVAGDASDRTFWRVSFPEPVPQCGASAVLMSYGADKTSGGLNIFLDVQKHMFDAGLPVPRIYCSDAAAGFVLMEDFGDVMLEHKLGESNNSEIMSLYEKSVDLIIDIQVAGERRMNPSCSAFSLAFDVEKLMFEFNFFYEHAILGLKKCEVAEGDEKVIRNGFLQIAEHLSGQKRYMTHRDYHSRNLMILNGGVPAMVDFQDARMGPRQYDLVSLLYDSYAKIPDSMAAELYSYYIEKSEQAGLPREDDESFQISFLNMAAQRSIKAAGSFAYLNVVKGKTRYMQYFPTALEYARTALMKLEGFELFRAVISKYVPELG